MLKRQPERLNFRALMTMGLFVAAAAVSACSNSSTPAAPFRGPSGGPTPTPTPAKPTPTPTSAVPTPTPSVTPTPPPSSGGSEAACVVTLAGTGNTYAFVPASSATDSQGYPDSLAEVTIATGTTISSKHSRMLPKNGRRFYTRNVGGRTIHIAAGAVSPLLPLTPGPSECGADLTHSNLYLISNGTIYPASPVVNVVNVGATGTMTQTGTFTTDATVGVGFSGGTFDITGIVYDGTDSAVVISSSVGYEMYGPTTPFSQIKVIDTAPAGPAENFGYNPTTDQVWSPTYSGTLSASLVDLRSGVSYLNSALPTDFEEPDSGAVDSSTNIAIAPAEGPGLLYLFNLNAATLAAPNFSAPATTFTLANVDSSVGTYIPASAVDAASHIAFLSGEFGTTDFCAAQLPTAPSTAAPTVSDYVCANFPNTPDDQPFSSPYDPHATSTFDLGGVSYGLMFNVQDDYVAVINLAKFLAAPREASPNQNTVMPTYDLVANNVVYYIPI